MTLFLAGLAGVLLGALIAAGICLYMLQKKVDRDLMERRVRLCSEYLESLGSLEGAFGEADGDPKVLDQAWHDVGAFRHEFRMTGWLLSAEVRSSLERALKDLEKDERTYRSNGAGSGARVAQALCEKCREVSRLLERELELQEKAFLKFRFLPGSQNR